MTELERLQEALRQQRAKMMQQEAALIPLDQKWNNANTNRFSGWLPGLIETVVDSRKRKKLEPEYQSALEQSLSTAAGVDDLTAQLTALQQKVAEEEAFNRKQQAAQGAGWGPASDAVALGIKTPEAPKPARGVMAEIPDGRGGLRKVLIDPTTGQSLQDYGSVPQTGAGKAPAYMDLVNPQTGATEKRMVGPDGRPGEAVGISKAAPAANAAATKDPDIREALSILDQAEQHFSPENTPWYGDSGPMDQHMPGKYQQTTKALRDQLFAVIKRIYKAPGEGQFSDADARAVYGMLFSPERYGDVNRELIQNLRAQLQGRLSGGQAANDDPLRDPLIDKYLKK